MRRNTYSTPIVLVIAASGLFGSLARSPSFHAYRTFDIVSLVVVGVCVGCAAALAAGIRRSLAARR